MGKKLAIKGHATRGEEVIELLEMMGGKNCYNLNGLLSENAYYFIGGPHNAEIKAGEHIFGDEDMYMYLLTLEEFLEEYPFKIGDKVRDDHGDALIIKSMWWHDELETMVYDFEDSDIVLTLECLLKYNNPIHKRTHEDVIFDSIIWHLRNSVNNGKQNLSGGECEDYFREVVKKNNENKMKHVLADLLEHIKTTPKEDLEREFEEIKEWSNVGPTVEEFRTFCECVNKKPVYPKTYAECAKIMNCPIDGPSGWLFNFDANIKDTYYRKIDILMGKFIRLRICRDAYWKIYGEQMGLDGPWKANFTQDSGIKYNILFANGEVIWNRPECEGIICSRVLAFPTPEIRDTFYENFKDLIESCKELL